MPGTVLAFHLIPSGSDGQESACHAGDPGSIPGSGRSPEKEKTTHSSILAWKIPWLEEPDKVTVHGVTKSRTRLSDFTHSLCLCYSQPPN